MTDQAWKEFAKDGWKHDEVPSKRDCFEAGWKACIEMYKSKTLWVAEGSCEDVGKLNNKPGPMIYIPTIKAKK